MQWSEGPNQSTIDEEVERLKLNCQHELNQMRVAALSPNIHEMEERARRIVDLTRKPRMPVDLGRTAMSEMKELELLGYQKATDAAIRKAMSYGLESKNAEKIRAITTARHFLSKSMARGASEEFKKATEMTLESAELTGKQQNYGATRAKPADEAPTRAVASAKNEQRGAKRYADPTLTVTIGSGTFQTVNWSISGFLLADCCRVDIEPGLQAPATVFGASLKTPMIIPTRIIRVDPETRRTSLTFGDDAPPEVYAFFKKLILAKANKGVSAPA